MPRGKSSNGSKNQMPEFVSCQLAQEELSFVQTNLFTDAQIADFFQKCVEAGFKVSLAYDSWNDAVLATITQKNDKEGKPGFALASRGPDVQSAITVSAYKLYHKLDGDLSEASPQEKRAVWG